jgi:hypothetical protein
MRSFAHCLLTALTLAIALLATDGAEAKGKRGDQRLARITARGRPQIDVVSIDLPKDLVQAKYYRKYLKKRLLRESKRAKWGAGRANVIQYRFTISELSLIEDDGVLRVRCTAIGKLPKGQAAKSRLTFSGDPKKRRQLVEKVLDIVARGVVTRLAELERIRRGDLRRSGVRAPRAVD